MAIRNYLSDAPMPQVADPLSLFSKAQSVRNLIQTGQQNEQELAINEQKLAQNRTIADKAKRIEDDTRKFGEVYLSAKGNPDETIRLAAEAGVHPELIQSFQQHNAKLAETAARTEAALIPVKKAKLDQAQGLLGEVESMAPEALVQAWPLLYQKALTLDPEAKDYLSPMQPPTAQQFAALNAAVATQKYHLEKADEVRKTAEAAQKATAAADVHAVQAADLPVKQAVAGATLADSGLLAPAQRSQANIAADSAKATATNRAMTLGEQRRHNLATEGAANTRMAGGSIPDGLVDSIAADPNRYFDLTATDKRKVLPALTQRGVEIGKPLSEKGIQTFSDMESGINSIGTTIAAIREGEKNVGPFAGWLTQKNPWASEGGKRLESQIALTRQLVGKGLEGGVLRKEDELKYEAILGSIRNTPGAAVEKLGNVQRELESKLSVWEKNQRGAGRSVPKRDSAPEGGGQKPVRKWNPSKGVIE